MGVRVLSVLVVAAGGFDRDFASDAPPVIDDGSVPIDGTIPIDGANGIDAPVGILVDAPPDAPPQVVPDPPTIKHHPGYGP